MGEVLVIDLMCKNDLCARVTYNRKTKEITNEQFSKVPHETIIGKGEPTVDRLLTFLRSRCFEEGRPDKKELLEYMGLTQYDPLSIVMVTKGQLTSDHMWVRFNNEDLTYETLPTGI